MPFLSRRKSMERYCFLCPPPRCQMVISPWELRPPVRFFGSTSDFSGVCLVISLLSSMVTKRRDAVYGLKLFRPITFLFSPDLPPKSRDQTSVAGSRTFLLQRVRVLDHFFAFRQLDVGFIPIAPVALSASTAAKLAVINRGANTVHLYFKNLLHRFFDLRLGGGHGDLKHHRVLGLFHSQTLFGDDRSANYLVRGNVHRL